MKLQNVRSFVLGTLTAAVLLMLSTVYAQDTGRAISENIGAVADQAKASIEEAGTAALSKIEQLWQRIDERRLKNRTRDEIIAWLLMGLLAGALAGLFTILRTTAAQRFGAVALGLVGAFAGGIVAHVAQLDFGMGPVLIRYEDLLLSVVGGLLLVLAVRFFKARRKGEI